VPLVRATSELALPNTYPLQPSDLIIVAVASVTQVLQIDDKD
jgi:hypothetical protein